MNSKNSCFLRIVLLTLALAGIWLGGVLAAAAASVTLTNGDAISTTSWNSKGNWNDSVAPNAANDYFTGVYTLRTPDVSLGAPGTNPVAFAGNSLSIDSGGQLVVKHYGNFTNNLILNGSVIQLGADFLVTNYGNLWISSAGNSALFATSGSLSRSMDIKSAIVSTNSGAGVLTISNIWGGLGGAYGVVLSGANTFTNVLVINNAEVKLNSATALGSTAGGTIITNGGMLDLNSISAGTEPVTISGGGTNGIVGAVVNNGASDISDGLRGPVTLAGDVVFGTLHRWDIMGTFTANGYKLTKVGGNQLCFNNSSANTDLGNIDVQAGTLTFFGGAGMGLSGSLLSVWTGANLNYWGSGTWNKTMSFTNA